MSFVNINDSLLIGDVRLCNSDNANLSYFYIKLQVLMSQICNTGYCVCNYTATRWQRKCQFVTHRYKCVAIYLKEMTAN